MANAVLITDTPEQALDRINNHDHTDGCGAQIPTGGIADGAVTEAKIADKAVSAAKIADGTIDITKLAESLATLVSQSGSGGAGAPGCFERDQPLAAYTTDNRYTLATPKKLWVNINDGGYIHSGDAMLIDISKYDAWDTKATLWAAAKEYKVDDVVYPGETSTGYIYRCTTAGTSSSLTPTWPTTLGETYNDGNCVWVCESDYTNADNRHGADFYVYACIPSVGVEPDFVVSANSTVPLGYTADTSRKIGGFHCLCADAGDNISDNNNVHPLSGYVAGDILPESVWVLKHRPKCNPEGMAYDDGTDMWYSIYLLSYTGSYATDDLKLVSKYNGVTADGGTTEKFHGAKFEQVLGTQKMRLPYQREFVAASIGSNQGTNIYGSADATTTGGHKDTAGRRMISNIGLEDCCGFLDQWGADVWGGYSNTWVNHYDGNDRYVLGKIAQYDKQILLGGDWDYAARCGSRYANWNHAALAVSADIGARGASEPLGA